MSDRSLLGMFWDNLVDSTKRAFRFLFRYPIALVVAAVCIVAWVLLSRVGYDFNIGGLIKYLFGRPSGQESVIAASNSIPKQRVDENGNEIPQGVADDRGWTQWENREFKTSPSPLRDKDTIIVSKPDGSEHEVKLPTGVRDTDVDEVIEVQPEVYVLRTNRDGAVSARDLLDDLPTPT